MRTFAVNDIVLSIARLTIKLAAKTAIGLSK